MLSDSISRRAKKSTERELAELMELFTLVEGHYTGERHQRSRSRIYRLSDGTRTEQEFRFVANQFDFSNKTFMGKTGPWRGDEI